MRPLMLCAVMLLACGSSPSTMPTILPPNVEQACDRAIACGVFVRSQKPECIACVETVAEKWNAEARAMFGDPLPPVESVACDVITDIAHRTHLSSCVVGRWYGP